MADLPMADLPGEHETTLRSITFKLPPADIERLRRIVKRRYPDERHKVAQVLRELIREEEARLERHERSGK